MDDEVGVVVDLSGVDFDGKLSINFESVDDSDEVSFDSCGVDNDLIAQPDLEEVNFVIQSNVNSVGLVSDDKD